MTLKRLTALRANDKKNTFVPDAYSHSIELAVLWRKHEILGYRPEVRVFGTLTKVGLSYYLFGGEGFQLQNAVRVLHPETWKWERFSISES
jgi:hypothetical protein